VLDISKLKQSKNKKRGEKAYFTTNTAQTQKSSEAKIKTKDF